MLPVCSAAPSCSSPSLVSWNVGVATISPLKRLTVEDKCFFGFPEISARELSFKLQASSFSFFPVDGSTEHASSTDESIFSSYPDEFDDIVRGFPTKDNDMQHNFNCPVGEIDGSCSINNEVTNLASSPTSEVEATVGDLHISNVFEDRNTENIMAIPEKANLQPQLENDLLNVQDHLNALITPKPDSASDTFSSNILDNSSTLGSNEVSGSSISYVNGDISDTFSDVQQSLDTSIFKAKSAIENTYNSFNTFIKETIKNATESFDNGIDDLVSSAGGTNEQVNGKLAGFSGEIKQSIYKASSFAVDALRQGLFSLEDLASNAATFIAYSYETAKNSLPPEVQNSLNITEEKATIILRPVGAASQKVYILIESIEKFLGFDPNDPITSFVIFLGSSATLGISYWFIRYGGYSGDLSPQLTMELLKKEKTAVLIDVRPEDDREKAGVPDLRRGARFKYASVSLPAVDIFTKKQLKNVKHVDDALLAVVIRNLQIVNNESTVIVMDANGNRSKEIARSLRRLGIKRPYLVEGGFRSWVKDGLRVKELKPETTLTVLNEEAEAILEDIKPTPALIFGSGLGLLVAIYALTEWEKTLQFIGVVGIVQSLYRRFTSYESSEDLKEDLRLLLTPVTLGAQAISSVAGNSEANKIGLPTSPSSTAVQDRVLQAAAKHESKPADSGEVPTGSLESSTQVGGEGLDLSEA